MVIWNGASPRSAIRALEIRSEVAAGMAFFHSAWSGKLMKAGLLKMLWPSAGKCL
jgi:hypothetical protein